MNLTIEDGSTLSVSGLSDSIYPNPVSGALGGIPNVTNLLFCAI